MNKSHDCIQRCKDGIKDLRSILRHRDILTDESSLKHISEPPCGNESSVGCGLARYKAERNE